MRKSKDIFLITFGIFISMFFVTKSHSDSISAIQALSKINGSCKVTNQTPLTDTTFQHCTVLFNESIQSRLDVGYDDRDCPSGITSNNETYYREYWSYDLRRSAGCYNANIIFEFWYKNEWTCPDSNYPTLNGTICEAKFLIPQSSIDSMAADVETVSTSLGSFDGFPEIVATETEIVANADFTLQAAAQAQSDSIYSNNIVNDINNLANNNPDIQSLSNYASDATTASQSAEVAAASALANATTAAAASLAANQAVLDASTAKDSALLAQAQINAAQADLNAATTHAQANDAVSAAAAAATAATNATVILSAALDSISNSAIQSGNASAAASHAASIASTAAQAALIASNGATSAVTNGEICTGDNCTAIPSPNTEKDEDEDGELTLNDNPTGESFYTSVYEDGFSGVMQPIIEDFKNGAFYSGMQTFVISGTSSAIPKWDMCFNTTLFNLGCGTFTIPAYIFDFIRICFIVMASFLCRAIVMGG